MTAQAAITARSAGYRMSRASRLYSPEMSRSLVGHRPGERIAAAMRNSGTSDAISAAQYADIKTYLAGDILTKVDRTSMAVSLEVRVPMLDHEFVEWAASVPSRLKLRAGEGKYILKRALEPYVPKENLYRPKQGFATSLAPYFRDAGGQFVREALLGEAMGDCGLFDMTSIGRTADAHLFGSRRPQPCTLVASDVRRFLKGSAFRGAEIRAYKNLPGLSA